MEFLSTGQVGCLDNHSVMQLRQNACSQTAACITNIYNHNHTDQRKCILKIRKLQNVLQTKIYCNVARLYCVRLRCATYLQWFLQYASTNRTHQFFVNFALEPCQFISHLRQSNANAKFLPVFICCCCCCGLLLFVLCASVDAFCGLTQRRATVAGN